jgi:hypothetical protein
MSHHLGGFEAGDGLDIFVTLIEKYKETRWRWPIQSPTNADRHCTKYSIELFKPGR